MSDSATVLIITSFDSNSIDQVQNNIRNTLHFIGSQLYVARRGTGGGEVEEDGQEELT